MKRAILFIILLFFAAGTYGQNKSMYDIVPQQSIKKTNAKTLSDYKYLKLDKAISGITLISGGYFTIGTNAGMSSSNLDDNCAITYGHPYALTSYPVFYMDGSWYKFEDYFMNQEGGTPEINGDTITINYNRQGKISLTFSLISQGNGEGVKLYLNYVNLDTVFHKVGFGFVIDPALGKWGDGYLNIKNNFINTGRVFDKSELPSSLTIWEKATGAKGIGLDVLFDSQVPDKLIAANWTDLYKDAGPVFSDNTAKKIYDLDLKFYWLEENIPSGNSKNCEMVLNLDQPDFSTPVFLRWDIPDYYSVDNNLMFPQGYSTYIEANCTGENFPTPFKLNLVMPSEISAVTSSFDVSYSGLKPSYYKADLQSHIAYEDTVVEVVAKVLSGENIVDEFHRYVFVPATPCSDTGLTVTIDTIKSGNYPNLEVLFKVKNNSTNAYNAKLTNENIFLYDNGTRINTYTLGKDLSGGVNSADIVFALDVTGSMAGSIDGVKNNIIEFADSLESEGIDYQLGLVTFLDVVENIYPFTKNKTTFQNTVAQQYAHGGDDRPENSLQALYDASKFSFRKDTKRIVIWITDADYHEKDNITTLTKNVVLNSLLANDVIVNCVGTIDFKTSYYQPITDPTGGNYYNITGKFRDILLDISRLKYSYEYLLKFSVLNSSQDSHQIKIETKYAGLGGSDEYYSIHQNSNKLTSHLSFYPNPFNPSITFGINTDNYSGGKIVIYNLLGQVVKKFTIGKDKMQNITWDASNDSGSRISTGFYIARLILSAPGKKEIVETAKILYLK